MKVTFEERMIEITKAEAKRASQYGSPEYHQLLAITTDLPAYRIMIKPVRRSGCNYGQIRKWFLQRCPEFCDAMAA